MRLFLGIVWRDWDGYRLKVKDAWEISAVIYDFKKSPQLDPTIALAWRIFYGYEAKK